MREPTPWAIVDERHFGWHCFFSSVVFEIWLWLKTVLGSHFGVGAPPILVYFSGGWDVHWVYDLDFDPWPSIAFPSWL